MSSISEGVTLVNYDYGKVHVLAIGGLTLCGRRNDRDALVDALPLDVLEAMATYREEDR